MRTVFLPFIALFVSGFILLLGNGLVNVLLPVRMGLEGISTDAIGMVLSLYYIGMLLGATYSKHAIARAGHIRMFAGCVAIGAVSILICSLYSDPVIWGAMRIVLGFCNACAFTAMESWLSGSSDKNSRGKVLAVYNAVILAGLFGGQFFMNIASAMETTLFVIAGILLCASIVPVALSHNRGPVVEEVSPMSLIKLYKISPLGVVSCLVSGTIYSAIFNLLPIYALEYNIVEFRLSLYMGAAIFGAFILQFPVGYLSDTYDRRSVLLGLLFISIIAGLLVTVLAPLGYFSVLCIATAITCGIISCTYPLSIAEVFDRLRQSEMIAAMGCMILVFSIGGIIGPYTAALMMKQFGNVALFYFLAIIQFLLAGFVLHRMGVRKALPTEEQEKFVMQAAAITTPAELDPRSEYMEHPHPVSAEAEAAIAIAEIDPAAAVKLARSMTLSNPKLGVEVAAAVAAVEGIDVLRLYEAMQEAAPRQILAVTRAIVTSQPELAYELVSQLAKWYPAQVVDVAKEIGETFSELRVEMAKVAVESAPESATQVAEYYAQVLSDEREALRPADREEDHSEQDAVNIASQLWQGATDQALDVATAMADAMPELSVPLAQEYILSNAGEITNDDQAQGVVDLVSRLAEAAPEQALDMAVAVVEAVPESAADVATEYAGIIMDSDNEAQTDSEEAVELVQRLSEASPENAMDVAVAVVEAVPDSTIDVAAEYAGNITDNDSIEQTDSEEAVELVQRLSDASPYSALQVAEVVIEALPESEIDINNAINKNGSHPV